MTEYASLGAASQDRKTRLAQLRSLKRKQPSSTRDDDSIEQSAQIIEQTHELDARSKSPTITSTFLSGRNYDPETRGPKLGFEHIPTNGQETLELQAEKLAVTTKQQIAEEETANKPLDLFKLQPKKPNWDLKRDLDKKLEILNVKTNNAIAKLVRERINKAQQEASLKASTSNDEDIAGLDGAALVEAMHVREKEGQESDTDLHDDGIS